MTDTKDRILDAAEKLFAEKGFADTSLRMITAEAGANLASVNYHFQSKDALILAVFARRLGPLNRARLAMLDEAETQAGDGRLSVEAVFRAFFEPLYKGDAPCARNPYFGRLLGRMYVEPGDLFERLFQDQLTTLRDRFVGALHRALPELPRGEIVLRMHFVVGTLAHTMAGFRHIEVMSQGLVDPHDKQAILEKLLHFVTTGFSAPMRQPVPKGEQA